MLVFRADESLGHIVTRADLVEIFNEAPIDEILARFASSHPAAADLLVATTDATEINAKSALDPHARHPTNLNQPPRTNTTLRISTIHPNTAPRTSPAT
jgi:hypothetical protein